MRGLVPFVQFTKREKYPWSSVTFSKVATATFLKVTLLHKCFSPFLNFTNSTKLRKASHTIEGFHANGGVPISNILFQFQTLLD